MEYKNKSAILYDHNEGGLSYRTLAEKYGINRKEVHRIVMSKSNKPKKAREIVRVVKEELPLPDVNFSVSRNEREMNAQLTISLVVIAKKYVNFVAK